MQWLGIYNVSPLISIYKYSDVWFGKGSKFTIPAPIFVVGKVCCSLIYYCFWRCRTCEFKCVGVSLTRMSDTWSGVNSTHVYYRVGR